MGLINWIFDIYQHTQIDKLRDETARARAEAAKTADASASSEPADLGDTPQDTPQA